MRFGIGFILLMLVLGGFAAYQGDRVGMAVGRKRLTIFGLRPKYTSRIVTVLTGIIIVSITMTSLLLISHSARQSLFGLEELEATLSDLTRQVSSLEARQQALIEENTTLQEQNVDFYTENEALAEQREQLVAANAALREEQQLLESFIEYQDSRIDTIRGAGIMFVQNLFSSRLVYQAQELIASYVIDVPATRAELTSRIEDILKETNERVLAAGAGEDRPGWALILEQMSIDEFGRVVVVTEEEHIEELIDSIWTEPGLVSVILQVLSETHAFEGSPIALDFRLIRNARVFYEGETVTAQIFDGRESGADLFNQLWTWLAGDVRQVAIDRGLLGSPDGTVTEELKPGVLFEVVERVQAIDGRVRVRAVAARDVWTSDELPLVFEYDVL